MCVRSGSCNPSATIIVKAVPDGHGIILDGSFDIFLTQIREEAR